MTTLTPEEKRFCIAITNAILALGANAGFDDGFSLRIMNLAEEVGISKMDLLDGIKPDTEKVVEFPDAS